MTLQEMIARQRELTEKARSESRNLTDEEQEEFDSLQRQIDTAVKAQEGNETPPKRAANNADGDGQGLIQAERTRIRRITEICGRFGMESESYIENGSTVDQVREAVLKYLEENNAPVSVRVTADEEDKRRNAITDGILLRNNIRLEHPAAGSEEFRGASLRMIAASCLTAEEKSGSRNYYMMEADELFMETMKRSYYNPTSAFPAIMDQTIKKAYTEGHKTAPVTFDRFTTRGTLSDFKKADNYYVQGSFGEFLEVPEGGELKHTLPVDEKLPQRQLKTYGRQFTMSRQAFINDDMGIITTMPRNAAKAARVTINNQVYRIMVGSQKVYDGKVLFGADHKNLLAKGTGVTREGVQSMILALGAHKTKDGQAITIRPGVIVVPLGYKFEMYTLFNSPTMSASGDSNPLYQYRDAIEIVEDATLNALVTSGAIPWYMVGDKEDTDFIQVDYLNGRDIPNIRRMEAPGQLGFTWDVYSDWGITVLDYRGAVKNPGIEIASPIETV